MKITSRRFILLTLGLLLTMGVVSPVQAQGILQGDTIPAGTLVQNDVALVGNEVTLAGDVDGNVFILGSQVLVSGRVSGSLIVLGGNVALDGEVGGAMYTGGLTLELGPNARLGRDLYAAAVSLVSQTGAQVERDLFALGLDLGGTLGVGRTAHTAIGPIQVYNSLMRLLGFEDLIISLRLIPPEPQPQLPVPVSTPGPTGRLGPVTDVNVSFASTRGLELSPNPTSRPARLRGLDSPESVFDWGGWALRLLRDWVVLFLFGLLTIWLLRKPLEDSSIPLRQRPWKTGGVGLLVLVIGVHLFWVALLISALLFAIGLWIGSLNLWGLSLAFLLAAYSLVGLLVAALWVFIVYGTKLIVAWCFGAWVFEKLIPRLACYRILPLLLGTVVYALLRSIPVAGWVVGVLVTAAGMGAAWLAWRTRKPPLLVRPPVSDGPQG